MKPRVLFYVQHLLGVGHVKRAAAIARAAAKTVDLHVALGGEPVALADFGAATVHQLPSARAEDLSFQVLLDATGRPIDELWRNRRRAALLDLASRIDPQVLLVEHYPFGRGKFAFELLPLFEMMKARPNRRILCSVRDVLVEKGSGAKSDKIVRLVRQWFDAVLVHGDETVIPFAATFPAASVIAGLLHYTGYVVDDAAPPAAVRDPSGEIVVSIGGGAVGQELLRAALDAAQTGALSPRHWRLLAGSNLAEPVFEALCAQASGEPRVTVERARPDFRALLGRAGLSISQAGYNTVMDILIAGCPALVVPFAAEAESEQLFRAREFERRGLLTVLEEGEMTAASLVSAAGRALTSNAVKPAMINLDGANGTAAALARYAGAS
jgi:predicted glycosyltransferase